MANLVKSASSKKELQQMRRDNMGNWIKGDFINQANPPQSFGANHKTRRSRYGVKWS